MNTSVAKNQNKLGPLSYTLFCILWIQYNADIFQICGNYKSWFFGCKQQKPIWLTSMEFYKKDKDWREDWKTTRLQKDKKKETPEVLSRWKSLKDLPQTSYVSSVNTAQDLKPKGKKFKVLCPSHGGARGLEQFPQRPFQLMYGEGTPTRKYTLWERPVHREMGYC